MYVNVKKIEYKKLGELYKQTVKEKRYFRPTNVRITSKNTTITFWEKTKFGDNDLHETTETINARDIVSIEINEDIIKFE